jgi:hypothetical protein
MSLKQMTYVFDDKTLKPVQKLIMLALADNANNEGVCFPSWNTIIEKTGISRGSLSANISILEQKRYLLKKNRNRKSGGRTSNKYLLYPSINAEKLDEDDYNIFEDLLSQSTGDELLKQKTQSTVDELGLYTQSTGDELECEPSLIFNEPSLKKVNQKKPHQTSSNTDNPTSSKNNDDDLEIEVIDEDSQVNEIQISKTYDEAKEVADYLLAKILNFNPTFKRENKSWIRDIELAIRLDGRDKKSLMNCIDWMYSSDKGRFWIANVLSGKKLREKFDTMNTQAMSFTGTNGLGYDVTKFVIDLCRDDGGVK